MFKIEQPSDHQQIYFFFYFIGFICINSKVEIFQLISEVFVLK